MRGGVRDEVLDLFLDRVDVDERVEVDAWGCGCWIGCARGRIRSGVLDMVSDFVAFIEGIGRVGSTVSRVVRKREWNRFEWGSGRW